MMTIAAQNSVSRKSEVPPSLAALLASKIEFVTHATFLADPSAPEHDFVSHVLQGGRDGGDTPTGLPSHLQQMCDVPLLTFEQEQALFRAMNYRKFKAHQLRSQLTHDTADLNQAVATVERLLEEASRIRHHLIHANMRLVISVVKKFVTTQNTFDEMLSDGLVALMNCVDKFDFDRGFRFSTYAYRSIARDAYRSVKATQLKSAQFSQQGEQWTLEPADAGNSSSIRDGFWSHLREISAGFLEHLDRRERFIIRCRYALGSHRKVKSLQYLANKLGVSKERVRQLEIRAVGKLQAMASEIEVDDVFGSAVL